METIGNYQVLGVVGEGGMGRVVKALDPRLDQVVAIKVIHPALLSKRSVLERSQREFQVLLSLRGHPNIVTVFDFNLDPFALVMEYIDGEPLDARIERAGALPPEQALGVMKSVLAALAFAHQKGILHRDMKASNVMLSRLGNQEVVKVMDFGLAGFASGNSSLTRDGTRMGTPAYMAPEQHLGRAVDERSDIYASGILLFQLLTGRMPFPDSDLSDYELARAHIEAPLPMPSSVCPGLEAFDGVVDRATRKDPNERYPSCESFLEDLQRVSAGETVPCLAPQRIASPARTILEEPDLPNPPRAEATAAPVPRRLPRKALFALVCAVGLLTGGFGAYAALKPPPYPRCRNDGHCKAREACVNHACVFRYPACGADKDCKDGESCTTGTCGFVWPKCAVDTHCRGAETCVQGACSLQYPNCRADSDCHDPESCAEGKCALVHPRCRALPDCHPGEICAENRCVTDWWCLCDFERDDMDAVLATTVCASGQAACQAALQAAQGGLYRALPRSVTRSCRSVAAEHPGDRFGGRMAWSRRSNPPGWQSRGRCLLP